MTLEFCIFPLIKRGHRCLPHMIRKVVVNRDSEDKFSKQHAYCPGSITNLLRDFRQVTKPLWALAFICLHKIRDLDKMILKISSKATS